MTLIINPGSGPVPEASEVNAHAAIRQFVNDLAGMGIKAIDIRQPNLDGDGRYGFALHLPDSRVIEVEMPGLPIDRVRYVGDPEQNIWDFPRLYVDGSSWVWKYALKVIPGDE
ncbi:hypothetical protein ACWERV_17245 [Streptomyces sp. NPDC004031]